MFIEFFLCGDTGQGRYWEYRESKTKSVFMESASQGLREGQKKKFSRRDNKCSMYINWCERKRNFRRELLFVLNSLERPLK